MTTDARLIAMETNLTPIQRARLVLQQWFATNKVDERLWTYCPPRDKDICQEICGSIGRAHESIWKALEITAEWIHHEDMRLGWLEALTGFREREAILLGSARRDVRLPEVPVPQRVHDRQAPLLAGRRAFAEVPAPTDWEEVIEHLKNELSRIIPLRWNVLISFEEAYGRATTALEVECMHPRTREAIDGLKRVVGGQAETMGSLGWPVELPAAGDGEYLEIALEHFDWAPLLKHGSPAWDPRRTMSEQQRADYEEWERQWAAEVETS
jgi:hypothetical protein